MLRARCLASSGISYSSASAKKSIKTCSARLSPAWAIFLRSSAWSRSCLWEAKRRTIWLITFLCSWRTRALHWGAASGARAGGPGTCEAERL
eukprot:3237692-Alexandrium_andersonii.AAC.1